MKVQPVLAAVAMIWHEVIAFNEKVEEVDLIRVTQLEQTVIARVTSACTEVIHIETHTVWAMEIKLSNSQVLTRILKIRPSLSA